MAAKKKNKKKKVAKKTRKKVTKKTSKKSAKKVSKKSTKKVTKKRTKKATKKAAKKQVKKVTRVKNIKKSSTKSSVVKKTSPPGKEKRRAKRVEKVAPEIILKEALSFLRTFNFLASDSDDCLERKCDNPATTGAYCRLHYIKNWKEIKRKERVLAGGGLIDHIEQLANKFSIKVIDALLEDISDDKNFYNALKNMNIDVAEEFFEDTDDSSSDESDIPFEAKNKAHLYDDE